MSLSLLVLLHQEMPSAQAEQLVETALQPTGVHGTANIRDREHFEDRAYAYFFVSSISKVNDSQFPFTIKVSLLMSVCARQPDGEYVREDVQLLWRGYQLAMGVMP